MTSTTPPSSQPDTARYPGILSIAGAALLAIGAFLPWATATSIFGQVSASGFDRGDGGKIAAGAGLVAAACLVHGLVDRNWSSYLLGALFAVIGGTVVGLDYLSISDKIDSVSDADLIARHGAGIYACLAGSLVATVFGFTATIRAKLATPPPTYTPV
jgi:hypothetical protein